ncbi:MAG: hypothetical protein FJX72_18540 [Armatimonadetes bacterium]|nr:hypothetical protein [Armatimonadota bacterium]
MGRETDAVRCFRELERRARQLRPHDPHSMRLVGLARMELGDLDAADRAYRRALKAGCWYARPEHEEVLRRLAERRQATD